MRVGVTAKAEGAAAVRWAVEPEDSASAQPGTDPVEVEAALAGVREGLAEVAASGVDVAGRGVDVTMLGISLVDTEPTAVKAAAAAATVDAFGLADRFEVVHDNGWTCRPLKGR